MVGSILVNEGEVREDPSPLVDSVRKSLRRPEHYILERDVTGIYVYGRVYRLLGKVLLDLIRRALYVSEPVPFEEGLKQDESNVRVLRPSPARSSPTGKGHETVFSSIGPMHPAKSASTSESILESLKIMLAKNWTGGRHSYRSHRIKYSLFFLSRSRGDFDDMAGTRVQAGSPNSRHVVENHLYPLLAPHDAALAHLVSAHLELRFHKGDETAFRCKERDDGGDDLLQGDEGDVDGDDIPLFPYVSGQEVAGVLHSR